MARKKKPKLPKPTEAELELLRVLWERGASTVREVHESLPGAKGTGYTTTLKILQLMAEKGLVVRDESQRSHVYEPVAQADTTQRQLVSDLLHRAFGGSPTKLVVQALSETRATAADLAEIREVLDALESKQKLERKNSK